MQKTGCYSCGKSHGRPGIADGMLIPPGPVRIEDLLSRCLVECGAFHHAGRGTAMRDFHRNIFSYYTGAWDESYLEVLLGE